jgi:hypothetical protein
VKKKLIAWCAAASVAVIILALLWGNYSSRSVCLKCGAFFRKNAIFLPGTSIRLFETSREEATAVSKALIEARWLSDHEHDWALASGSGKGFRCWLGKAHQLVTVVDTEEYARLIHACARWGDKQLQDEIASIILDPYQPFEVYSAVYDLPLEGFEDQTALKSWLAKLRSSVPINLPVRE